MNTFAGSDPRAGAAAVVVRPPNDRRSFRKLANPLDNRFEALPPLADRAAIVGDADLADLLVLMRIEAGMENGVFDFRSRRERDGIQEQGKESETKH